MARIIVLLLTLTVLSCASRKDVQTNTLPNIIYIYADDLGVGDVGCYGQQYIKTPNLDRMAAEGMRFTRHYTGAPICAPARCTMLTGKHAGNAYIRMNYEIKDSIPSRAGQMPIPDETVTIAEVLKKSGYATGVIGKWGLGSIESSGNPNKQGFDFFYGYADQVHAHNHYPPFLWRNGEQDILRNDVPSVHPKYGRDKKIDAQEEYKKYMGEDYSLDVMTEEAKKFIDRNKNTPFFLYVPYVVPHKALQVPDESLARYEGVFDEAPYDGKRGYTPHPRPLSAYAAMITRMDAKIGEILAHLRDGGLQENTLVMFSSDNGPAGGGGLDAEFFNSAAGLRGSKGQVFEGGIREPFIAYWPGKVPAGVTTDHLSAQYDLMATLAELTGQTVMNTDGISFLPTLLGRPQEQKQHEYMYWELPRGKQIAVRIGDMKGILMKDNPRFGDGWAVYNLATDEKETTNIAAQHPDLVEKFKAIANKRTPAVIEEWNF